MENNKETSNGLKRSWFQELQGEFRKITWPDKTSLAKKSVAVMISAILIGVIISGLDYIIEYCLAFIVG